MTTHRPPHIARVLDLLKAKLDQLEQPLPPEEISEIRNEATGFYDHLSATPNLDNPHWREVHDMVCAVLSRTASTVPGAGRSRVTG